eukprot:gb/GECH01008674.1/.p1 GENE.gb/GECH01008674.1/~~gb/GECH01008674.1/.p1  ORF type:complete len:399 (+),score=88.41 gb/GECH01008674.1/:1-1197(+)
MPSLQNDWYSSLYYATKYLEEKQHYLKTKKNISVHDRLVINGELKLLKKELKQIQAKKAEEERIEPHQCYHHQIGKSPETQEPYMLIHSFNVGESKNNHDLNSVHLRTNLLNNRDKNQSKQNPIFLSSPEQGQRLSEYNQLTQNQVNSNSIPTKLASDPQTNSPYRPNSSVSRLSKHRSIPRNVRSAPSIPTSPNHVGIREEQDSLSQELKALQFQAKRILSSRTESTGSSECQEYRNVDGSSLTYSLNPSSNRSKISQRRRPYSSHHLSHSSKYSASIYPSSKSVNNSHSSHHFSPSRNTAILSKSKEERRKAVLDLMNQDSHNEPNQNHPKRNTQSATGTRRTRNSSYTIKNYKKTEKRGKAPSSHCKNSRPQTAPSKRRTSVQQKTRLSKIKLEL